MKHIKKVVTLFLTFAMVLAMSATVFADDTYTITINKATSDKAAHTYGAYQLFKGDLATVDGKTVLSNIQWGDNVSSGTLITELKKISAFSSLSDTASAKDVAKAIGDANISDDSAAAKELAEAVSKAVTGTAKGTTTIAADATSGTITELPAGYYLVKDDAAVSGEGAKTRYILEVVDNVTVTEKADVPTVDKTVGTEKKNVSDYNIGDPVPYTITGTLPSNFADYKTYKTYTFTDTMSAGLTPPAAADVSIKVGDDDVTSLFDVNISGQTMTISLKSGVDLKTAKHGSSDFVASDKIVVTYNAVLNDNAVIGGTGNDNTVDLTFSNNPNSGGDGDTGTTPPDKVVVFTYKIIANKVNESNQPLAGAGFTLYKEDGTTVVKTFAAGDATSFEFKGVDAGTYILKETTVPTGYNKVDDITITITAQYDETKNPPEISSLTCTPTDFTVDLSAGSVTGTIKNQKGSELPSTGGIGTVIFYTLGSLLVIGCGIVLISRKRTNN